MTHISLSKFSTQKYPLKFHGFKCTSSLCRYIRYIWCLTICCTLHSAKCTLPPSSTDFHRDNFDLHSVAVSRACTLPCFAVLVKGNDLLMTPSRRQNICIHSVLEVKMPCWCVYYEKVMQSNFPRPSSDEVAEIVFYHLRSFSHNRRRVESLPCPPPLPPLPTSLSCRNSALLWASSAINSPIGAFILPSRPTMRAVSGTKETSFQRRGAFRSRLIKSHDLRLYRWGYPPFSKLVQFNWPANCPPDVRMYTRLQTVWSLPGHSRQANKGHSPLCHRRPRGPGRLADKVVQPTTQSAEGCTYTGSSAVLVDWDVLLPIVQLNISLPRLGLCPNGLL